MKGTAAVFNGPGLPFIIKEFDLPALGSKEILVRVEMCTLCRSDIHTYCGNREEPTSSILGHEIVGTVVDLPADPMVDIAGNRLSAGDRVSWSIFASDDDDEFSKRGMPQKAKGRLKYGHQKITQDWIFSGGLATHCHLQPGTSIALIPQEVPLAAICPVNCSLATIIAGFRLADGVRGRRVLVTGGGMLGIHAVAYASLSGATEVGVIDLDRSRLKRCQQFGATDTFLEDGSFTTDREYDVTLDTSGSGDAMRKGVNLLTTGGTAVWVGGTFSQEELGIDPEMIIRRLLTIRGMHNYNRSDFEQAINFMVSNHNVYPYVDLVQRHFQLDQINEAMEYAIQEKPYRVGVIAS